MRVSLRLRVLTLVGTINVAVFGAGLGYLSSEFARAQLEQKQETAQRLVRGLQDSISMQGELRVGQILASPVWEEVSDAIIVDRNLEGVSLNPVGVLGRGGDFDRPGVLASIDLAVRSQETVPVEDGFVLPIIDRRGRAWGGCWYRVAEAREGPPLWMGLLPWFFASTLLLSFGTYGVLRRYVLRPVSALSRGARHLQRGDFSAPIARPRHSDELADLIETFNTMAAEVRGFHEYLENEADAAKEKAFRAEAAALRQRRLAAMGELAAGIAHEINNPLGGMLNAVDVLEKPGTSEEKRSRYHALLRNGLERIQRTVQKLLRFTPRQGEHEPLDLAGPVHDAVELLRHRAESLGVELDVDLDESDCIVRGQRSELGQAVLNLLVNALDAVEPQAASGSARIVVELRAAEHEVTLTVTDDGPGIPEEDIERVADLFYTTKEVGRGTGLGLALVHSVVDQHGGRVHLRNAPERGLRVEVVLPLVESELG